MCCLNPALNRLLTNIDRTKERIVKLPIHHQSEKNKISRDEQLNTANQLTTSKYLTEHLYDVEVSNRETSNTADRNESKYDPERLEYTAIHRTLQQIFELYAECNGFGQESAGSSQQSRQAYSGMRVVELEEAFTCCVVTIHDEAEINVEIAKLLHAISLAKHECNELRPAFELSFAATKTDRVDFQQLIAGVKKCNSFLFTFVAQIERFRKKIQL
jgi:hypothetical protein